MLPEHVEARQLLAEVCRAAGDGDAAAHHLDVLVHVMRRRGQADAPPEDPLGLPPMEEWVFDEGDPLGEVAKDIRGDVERLVDQLHRKSSASS